MLPSHVQIEKVADHLLILGAILLRFPLEKIHAGFAQRNRDFDILFLKDELLRRRKEVVDHAQIA
mgnify:FL=1